MPLVRLVHVKHGIGVGKSVAYRARPPRRRRRREEETTRLRSKARAISPDIVHTLQGNMAAYEL
jgi:hypothetical protein